MSTLVTTLRRLRRDKEGAAVIETAIALPVLLMLAFAFVDLTQAFAFRMTMQEYAQSGADFVNASGQDTPTDTEVKTAISQLSGLPTSAITIIHPFDCNGRSASLESNGCPNVEDIRVDYMKITVKSSYTPVLKVASFADFMPSGDIAASATVRMP
ncbi:MAG: pilus assembly protein [Novosphingobium sp.]|nr:pilus assembly protein [Novosphingobium sp.]